MDSWIFKLGLAALLLIVQSSTSDCSNDSFSSPSPACPGERVTFHCTVCDPGSSSVVTVWLVTKRLRPCLVQNWLPGRNETCGPGRKFTSQAGESDGAGCYPSTLSTTAELDLNGIRVECVQSGEENLVGNGTLKIIGPATISRIEVHLIQISNTPATVTVHWEVEGENITSYTIISAPALPCGDQCVVGDGEREFESGHFNLTVELGVEYSIIVRADNCEDRQNGTESEPHELVFSAPGIVDFIIDPLYSALSGDLLMVTMSWNYKDPIVKGVVGVTGEIQKFIVTVASESVPVFSHSTAVNSSECLGGECSYLFTATGWNITSALNVSVIAVNSIGVGPSHQPQSISLSNNLLALSVEGFDDATGWRVTCSFLSAFPGSDATCRIDYGTDSSYTNLPYSDESTETGGASDSVSIQLQRLNSTTTYYYRVSAIEIGGRIVTVQGSFTTTGIFRGTSAFVIALSSSLLAIFLLAGVLVGVLSYHCLRRRKSHSVQPSPQQQSTQSVQSQPIQITEPEYEEVIPIIATVDIEIADNVAYRPIARQHGGVNIEVTDNVSYQPIARQQGGVNIEVIDNVTYRSIAGQQGGVNIEVADNVSYRPIARQQGGVNIEVTDNVTYQPVDM